MSEDFQTQVLDALARLEGKVDAVQREVKDSRVDMRDIASDLHDLAASHQQLKDNQIRIIRLIEHSIPEKPGLKSAQG